MEAHLGRFIDIYTRAIKENNAAVFAGAGLSIPSGFVNWKNLLRDIAKELDLDIDQENDLIAIAQYHYNERGNNRHKLNQLLINEFTQGSSVTPNHKILASLPIQIYWTTNYDKLLERALDEAGKTPDTKITQENLSINIPKRDAVVYKMHGDISMPDQAVLTKDDYEGYNEKRPLFTTALQGDLVAKTFLFIGFSFDDPNLEYILSRIRILLGQNQRDHYCFFKKAVRADFKSDVDFHYAEIKQQLKIKDLRRYDLVIVMVGPNTYKAPGVLKEVQMANELGKKIIQIIGYKDGAYTRVEGAGVLYSWNWDNLKKLLSQFTRKIIASSSLTMESLAKLLFDFNKLPSNLMLVICILSGIILFVPPQFLVKIQLSNFNQAYGQWVGIAFISSISFLAVSVFTTIKNGFVRRSRNRGYEESITNSLQKLDPLEQSILRELFIVSSTINLPMDHASVVGLQDKGIIRLAQT